MRSAKRFISFYEKNLYVEIYLREIIINPEKRLCSKLFITLSETIVEISA